MRILLTALLLGATSSVALAADLPSRVAPPAFVPPPIPVFSWTGFYLGGNAGYAFDNRTRYRFGGNTGGAVPATATSKDDGFTGGLQIGYNFELGGGGLGGIPVLGGFGGGGIVAGVEADAAYTDLNDTTRAGTGGASLLRSRTDFVGTARGRLGIAAANALLYGTGGFAYGGVRNNVNLAGAGGAGGTGGSDKIRTGFAYGGGVEYAIPTTSFVNFIAASAVTLKVEYLRYELGSDSLNIGGRNVSIRNEGNIVRAGINYKFGAPAIPVVARY